MPCVLAYKGIDVNTTERRHVFLTRNFKLLLTAYQTNSKTVFISEFDIMPIFFRIRVFVTLIEFTVAPLKFAISLDDIPNFI